ATAVHALQLIAGSRGRSRRPADDVPRVALLTRRGSCHFGPDITYAKLFQAAEEGAFAFDLSENVGTLFVENIRDWEKRRRWTSTFLQMLWRSCLPYLQQLGYLMVSGRAL
ncbi:hypothetical protein FOZ62_000221, partial [Perkinsus olseni]